ncbi:hypothetical protein OHB49_43180 (plasmid) [Streptomyces sp. NBC_01717]|uniref:hypothetical protein n=1 Tax=Streptomyces sp. NBC_01717 TaxID=2975918 RepID=UPI002E37BF26|nr:hypothetical protein [Streptomyces sp. NBC_01717]
MAAEDAGVADGVGVPAAVAVVAVPDVLSCQTPVPVPDPAAAAVGEGAEAMTSLSPAGL